MIVWITGPATTGKTWLDDFLQHYQGWVHVEGDRPQHIKKDSAITQNLLVAFFGYWVKLKPAPFKFWPDCYQSLCNEILQIFKEDKGANIVLTFAAYLRVVRDFAREQKGINWSRFDFYFARCIEGGVLKTKCSPSYGCCESIWFNHGRILEKK